MTLEDAILGMLQGKRQGCWRWQKRGLKDFVIEISENMMSAGAYERIGERLHPAQVYILKQLHGRWNVVARIGHTGWHRVTGGIPEKPRQGRRQDSRGISRDSARAAQERGLENPFVTLVATNGHGRHGRIESVRFGMRNATVVFGTGKCFGEGAGGDWPRRFPTARSVRVG